MSERPLGDAEFVLEQAIIDGNRRLSLGDAELLLRVVEATDAHLCLEIGSADGCSSIVLGIAMKRRKGHLYCIEPRITGRWVANMANWGLNECVLMIGGASPWVPLDKVPGELDVLFIDGVHKTRWALVDYHYWMPKVRVGGAVVFHDFCGAAGYKEQVRRAIAIIQETDKLTEIDRAEGPDKGCIAFRKEAAK